MHHNRKHVAVVGATYGSLTVLSETRLPPNPSQIRKGHSGYLAYLCSCTCGRETTVRTDALCQGRTETCGECYTGISVSANQRFTKLTVMTDPVRGDTEIQCLCDCGSPKMVNLYELATGKIKSCGCSKNQLISESRVGTDNPYYAHGLSKHPHYHRARNAIKRCHNPRNSHYEFYGARGIQVYEPWRNDISLFIHYLDSLGPLPAGYSMDRIDTNGNYEPGNIQWASASDQMKTRRPFRRAGV